MRWRTTTATCILVICLADAAVLPAQSASELLARAEKAARKGELPAALESVNKAIELDPKNADAFQLRGEIYFKGGDFANSVKDFDQVISLRPTQKARHWQRGISLYYAGQYHEGRRQFEGYQSFDSNDVENAVWRFMCMARSDGLAKARSDMLKIGDDKRVPMRQVYDLFAGKLKPEEMLAAATANDPPKDRLNQQQFYAHLYLGIYYDLMGDRNKALEHLEAATEKHRIGHYMWDVARVHRDLLSKNRQKQ